MKRLELIDFLKGFSIFTIIVYHFLDQLILKFPFNKLILFGGTGVHLFVLISGLGLYLSYLKKPIPYLSFLQRRFSKIYAPYILIILISAFISFFIPVYPNSWYALGGHVFMYKMFDETIMGSYGYPLWFISLIFQFYLVFYVLVYFKKKTKNSWFILICLLISNIWPVLVVMLGKEDERIWNSFFLQHLWEFAIGMVIATMIASGNNLTKYKFKPIYFLLAGILNCALYAALALKCGEVGKMFNDIPALIGYSCIAIWIYLLGIQKIKEFFLFTGRISYSLYLTHILILNIAMIAFKRIHLPLTLSFALIFCYLLSFYYQKLVDWGFKILGQ